jgi:methylthioribose-1-phosphate isomerase
MAAHEPLRILPGIGIEILDQTLLPGEERVVRICTLGALCEAISALRVRGAPLLGLAAACGMAIAAETTDAGDDALREACAAIDKTRPTAVDLGDAARAALARALAAQGAQPRRELLWADAVDYLARRVAEDRALAAHGRSFIPHGSAALTHCNTGALATAGIGTALGVLTTAWDAGVLSHCYVTETRPLLQGARLTTWELARAGVPTTLLPDTAVASLLASGRVGVAVTGADRIAANGDTANKVGTYGIALAAARHGVPFVIAAPTSTVDISTASGAAIPVEFRANDEVGGFGAHRWAPDGLDAYNPAFDVTPADLITAIVTERGVARPPFAGALAALKAAPSAGR